jgi:hypothetical protein
MIEPDSVANLKEAIADCIASDEGVLTSLRDEIRPLRSATRKIQPRATTSISLVGTDGGNNQLQFDPFLIQLVRVVDSSNNEYCLEAVSPTTPIAQLDARQFSADGTPQTALGELMAYVGVRSLTNLSHMIRSGEAGRPVSPSWVQVYRELVEWAILFSILKKDFGTDTLMRHWFLGGPATVEYRHGEQIVHTSPDAFTNDLRKVWRNAADGCETGARLVIRFVGIADRSVNPLDIVKASLRDSGWRLETLRAAGDANSGKRQAETFMRTAIRALTEHDVWARLQ